MGKAEQQPKTAKARLLQDIFASGLRVFKTSDLQKITEGFGINLPYTRNLVSGLIQEGCIDPIKRGVYKLNLVTGVSPIHEFEIAMYLVKPAMVSHYSAFYHHSLTKQVPQRVYISTMQKVSYPSWVFLEK